jgi:predicted nucleic acid-binding protein
LPERVVIDASVCVELVLPLPLREQAYCLVRDWQAGATSMHAPELWLYEVCSSLRKHCVTGLIARKLVVPTLDYLLGLGIQRVPPDRQLGLSAVAWSERTNQRAAYDAAYLALADRLGCPLWTADKRLYHAARDAGAEWVHLLGEDE